jgi:uncharacterized protein (DUF1015 family)
MCAKLKPFRAIRPTRDKVHLVASRPYYTYNKNVLEAKLESNPYSFIHIINPEFNKEDKTLPNSNERFQNVHNKYVEFKQKGIFVQDEKECFYIYRQSGEKQDYIGIIAGASVEDYEQGNIKIHEQTLTEREEMFKRYLDICGFNAEPVLLTYKDVDSINQFIKTFTKQRPEYEFTTTDILKHEVWVVSEEKDIAFLKNEFEKVPHVYIADGHHRSASSYLLAKERKANNPNHSGNEDYNFFLSFYITETSLDIFDFNRLITDTNGLSEAEILEKISTQFDVEKTTLDFKPTQLHEFSMHSANSCYKLTYKGKIDSSSAVETLDAHILSKQILEPLFGMKDLKTDKRCYFMEGIQGVKKMRNDIEKGKAKLAFGLYPVSVNQLKDIADTNSIMPPKTTWIEPKMRSGLIVYEF